MEILKIIGIGLIGTTAALIVGEYKKELSFAITVATGVIIMALMINQIEPIIDAVDNIFMKTSLDKEYVKILIKALGICFLTQIAVDSCKDSGNTAIAAKVEIAGKILVLFVALPLFLSLLELVGSLIWI